MLSANDANVPPTCSLGIINKSVLALTIIIRGKITMGWEVMKET
jgi:hypothetical protein